MYLGNIKRCISIFLNLANQQQQPMMLLANLRQLLMTMLVTIKDGFREISEEEAIDEMLDTNEHSLSEGTISAEANVSNFAQFTVQQPVNAINTTAPALGTAPALSSVIVQSAPALLGNLQAFQTGERSLE